MNNDLIYNKKYDYDDLKIAVVVSNYLLGLSADNTIDFCDYEDIAELTIEIKNAWEDANKKDELTQEQFAYIQSYATDYLKENIKEIIKNLKNTEDK